MKKVFRFICLVYNLNYLYNRGDNMKPKYYTLHRTTKSEKSCEKNNYKINLNILQGNTDFSNSDT